MSAVDNAVAAATTTDLAALPVAQRAAIVLKSADTEKELAELAAKHKDITVVTNADGREQAHRAYMVLKNARIALERRGKEARDDATKFGKAVIAEENRLVALIDPEETRLQKLRDDYDNEQQRIKDEAIARERARAAALDGKIDEFRQSPAAMVGKSSAEVQARILELEAEQVTEAVFQERFEAAVKVRDEALAKLRQILQERIDLEAQQKALAEERERLAEQKRREDEAAATRKREQDERDRQQREEQERQQEQQRQAQQLERMRREEIDGIRHQAMIAVVGRLGVREGGTLQCALDTYAETDGWPITAENFGPLVDEAKAVKAAVLLQIGAVITQRRQDAERAEQRRIEDEQMAQQREKLRQQQEEQKAEQERQEQERLKIAQERAYIQLRDDIAKLKSAGVQTSSLEEAQDFADELAEMDIDADAVGQWKDQLLDMKSMARADVLERVAALRPPAPPAKEHGVNTADISPSNRPSYPGHASMVVAIANQFDVSNDTARDWLVIYVGENVGGEA